MTIDIEQTQQLGMYLSRYTNIDLADDLSKRIAERIPETHATKLAEFLGAVKSIDEGVRRARSCSYREYDVEYGTDEYTQWESWMRAHNIPLTQVPFKGWAARDIRRNTVSVLLFDWNDGDEQDPQFGTKRTTSYIDKDDEDTRSNSGIRFRVYTVQLDHKPLPFPETTGQG